MGSLIQKTSISKNYKLRNNSRAINLPEKYWKAAGWKINDELMISNITVLEDTLDGKSEFEEISIKRRLDLTEDDQERMDYQERMMDEY